MHLATILYQPTHYLHTFPAPFVCPSCTLGTSTNLYIGPLHASTFHSIPLHTPSVNPMYTYQASILCPSATLHTPNNNSIILCTPSICPLYATMHPLTPNNHSMGLLCTSSNYLYPSTHPLHILGASSLYLLHALYASFVHPLCT